MAQLGEGLTSVHRGLDSISDCILDVVAHTCNPSIQEVGTERLEVQGQPGQHSNLEASLDHMRFYLS